VVGIAPNRILRNAHGIVGAKGCPCVWIRIEPRGAARSNVNAQPMSFVENDARGPQINFKTVNLSRLQQVRGSERFMEPRPDSSLANIERTAVRIDVAQPHEEISIGSITGSPELRADPARNLEGVLESLASKDQYVRSIFY